MIQIIFHMHSSISSKPLLLVMYTLFDCKEVK